MDLISKDSPSFLFGDDASPCLRGFNEYAGRFGKHTEARLWGVPAEERFPAGAGGGKEELVAPAPVAAHVSGPDNNTYFIFIGEGNLLFVCVPLSLLE